MRARIQIQGIGITDHTASGTLTNSGREECGKPKSLILAAKNLTPALVHTVQVNRNIAGVVVEVGSITSHAAVLLRELTVQQNRDIAALSGISTETINRLTGDLVSIDGINGLLSLDDNERRSATISEPRKEPVIHLGKGSPIERTRKRGKFVCPRPNYSFTPLEQSLIAPGYAQSFVTLFGENQSQIEFDTQGRIWILDYKSGNEIATLIARDPFWFYRLATRQHQRFARIFRYLLSVRLQWLDLEQAEGAKEIIRAWRYIEESSYHLYRFLPLTSSSYPYLFETYLKQLTLTNTNKADSVQLLRRLGRTSIAAVALANKIFPEDGKSVLDYMDLTEPYAMLPPPASLAEQFIKTPLDNHKAEASKEWEDSESERTVKIMYEAKDEKFYLSSTISSWTAFLLTVTKAYLERKDRSLTILQLSDRSVEEIICLLQE
jgi:phosphohistidine swiveling domain-containing protein